MDKFMYDGQDVTKLFRKKEKALISLYAKEKEISDIETERMYNTSKLKNIMQNLDNELWLESEYFILDNYKKLMEERCTAYVHAPIAVPRKPIEPRVRRGQSKKRNDTLLEFDQLSPEQQAQIKKQIQRFSRENENVIKRGSKISRVKARKRHVNRV